MERENNIFDIRYKKQLRGWLAHCVILPTGQRQDGLCTRRSRAARLGRSHAWEKHWLSHNGNCLQTENRNWKGDWRGKDRNASISRPQVQDLCCPLGVSKITASEAFWERLTFFLSVSVLLLLSIFFMEISHLTGKPNSACSACS